MKPKYSPEVISWLESVTGKRAKRVIDKILADDFCTTEDLKKMGYEHPPRAARDVRELGIPLETKWTLDSEGRRVGMYVFGDLEKALRNPNISKAQGRTTNLSKVKKALLDQYGPICNIYREPYPANKLQPDHRIPYEIGGDPEDITDTKYFQLLSPSANRAKSWDCEHCSNWQKRNPNFCKTCYWAYPEKYHHIADIEEYIVQLVFKNGDADTYRNLANEALQQGISVETLIKKKLKEC